MKIALPEKGKMHHNGSQISHEYDSSVFLKEPPCLLMSG